MSIHKESPESPTQSSAESSVSREDSLSCSLRLESGSAAFVCGSDEHCVPPQSAERSELIADLLKQSDDGQKCLPVPLSIVEGCAWLAVSAPSRCQDARGLSETEDEMLLQALKVNTTLPLPTSLSSLLFLRVNGHKRTEWVRLSGIVVWQPVHAVPRQSHFCRGSTANTVQQSYQQLYVHDAYIQGPVGVSVSC